MLWNVHCVRQENIGSQKNQNVNLAHIPRIKLIKDHLYARNVSVILQLLVQFYHVNYLQNLALSDTIMKGFFCTKCPHNHTTPMLASLQIHFKNSCVCVSGFEKISSFECAPCSIKFYSPSINSSCILSPVGSFVPHSAMSHHIQCQKIFISTTAGSSSCTPCPSNTYSNLQNTMCLPSVASFEEIPTIYEYQINF